MLSNRAATDEALRTGVDLAAEAAEIAEATRSKRLGRRAAGLGRRVGG